MRARSAAVQATADGRTIVMMASLLLLAALFIAFPARADDLVVKYDQSELVDLPQAVAEIIIGNPMIAEVTVHSAKQLLVTGKSFGVTNMIALDRNKKIIARARITVQRDEAQVLTLLKGSKRQTYNCAPQCNPMVTVGDDKDYFGDVSGAAKAKNGLATTAPGDQTAEPQE